jgi:hypothetical protein
MRTGLCVSCTSTGIFEQFMTGVIPSTPFTPINRLDDLLPWARVDEGSRLKLAA